MSEDPNLFAGLMTPPEISRIYLRKDTRRNRGPRGRATVAPEKAPKLRDLPQVDTPWSLSPHQVLMVRLMASGMANKEISAETGVGLKTIEAHLGSAYLRMSAVEGGEVNRVRAAVLWDRFARQGVAQ